MILKINTKKTMLLMALFLAACSNGGGGGSSATSATSPVAPQPINGIAVPPEPNPSINNATILGVDSNNNGVRDDVERQIASTYGANAAHYDAAMRSAIADQGYLVANGDPIKSTAATSNAAISGACVSVKYGSDSINGLKSIRHIFTVTFNTQERMAAYRATSAASTEVSTTIPSDPCK